MNRLHENLIWFDRPSNKWWLASVLIFIAALFSGCAQFSNRTVQGAIPVSASAEKQQQDQLDMQFGLTRIVERKGKLEEAEKSYLEIIAVDPDYAPALHRLGVIAAGQEDLSKAVEYMRTAASVQPDSTELLGDLGYTFMLMGEMPMAERYLGQAFQASPDDHRITNNLALVVGYQGNLKEALTLFRRCNAESEALANVGYLLSQRGDMEKARQYFHEALNLDPTLRQAADGLVEVDKAMKLMAAVAE